MDERGPGSEDQASANHRTLWQAGQPGVRDLTARSCATGLLTRDAGDCRVKPWRSRRWSRRLTAWLMVLCFLGMAPPAQAATATSGRLGFAGVTAWLQGLFASHPAAVVPAEKAGRLGLAGRCRRRRPGRARAPV